MFEVGKAYAFKVNDGEGVNSFKGNLLAVNLPLIEVERSGGKKVIINVGSSDFVSAELEDDLDRGAAELVRQESELDSIAQDIQAAMPVPGEGGPDPVTGY